MKLRASIGIAAAIVPVASSLAHAFLGGPALGSALEAGNIAPAREAPCSLGRRGKVGME